MVYLFVAFFLLTLGLEIARLIIEDKERKEMTVEKFKERVNKYVSKKDGKGLSDFLRRNMVFVLLHGEELQEYAKGLDVTQNSIEKIEGGVKAE